VCRVSREIVNTMLLNKELQDAGGSMSGDA